VVLRPALAAGARAHLALALALSLALALFPATAGEKNLLPVLDAKILATSIPDLTGKAVRPLACKTGERAAVLIFTSVDCPVSNSYAPEIDRIAVAYAARGVRLTLVHVDPSLDSKEAARHASEYGLDRHTSIVIDRKHRLVAATGATITPEAAVITPAGEVAYRGRINDLYADLGDKRAAPSEHNLRDALDAVLAGQPVPTSRTEPIGCLIEPLD